jgi:hypothetical protein
MSDSSQGPGWWQASDGKWYAPEAARAPGVPPATAKKGGCLKWALIGGGALVLVIVIAAIAGGGGGKNDNTSVNTNATDTTAAPDTPANVTAQPTATTNTPKASGKCNQDYPDKQKGDLCPGSAIELSGYTTTFTKGTRVPEGNDVFGKALICAEISILNRDDKSQSYNEFDFKLQTPGGDVQDITIHSQEPKLGSGSLVTGGTKSGKVCFEDPGANGRYVVIWKPDSFNADRGLWFITV